MEIVPKRKWRYPLAIEREYAKQLAAYVDKEMEIVESFLPEIADSVYRNSIRTDGIGDWLGNLVDKVQRKVRQKLSALPAINRIFKQVNHHVSREMTETTESLFWSSWYQTFLCPPYQYHCCSEVHPLQPVPHLY